jgi:hypothetical protein
MLAVFGVHLVIYHSWNADGERTLELASSSSLLRGDSSNGNSKSKYYVHPNPVDIKVQHYSSAASKEYDEYSDENVQEGDEESNDLSSVAIDGNYGEHENTEEDNQGISRGDYGDDAYEYEKTSKDEADGNVLGNYYDVDGSKDMSGSEEEEEEEEQQDGEDDQYSASESSDPYLDFSPGIDETSA